MKKCKLELLDSQIDIILHSLEMYSYVYNFAYCQKGKEEERLITAINQTYELILEESTESHKPANRQIYSTFKAFEKKIKNF